MNKIQLNHLKSILLKQYYNLTYQLTIKKSEILLNANYGVYMNGFLTKDQIVCLYPGRYSPPPPVLSLISSSGDSVIKPNQIFNNPSDSEYIIHCNNIGGYIDGYNYKINLNNTLSDYSKNYLVGHMINHPNRNHKPNVKAYDFYWDDILKLLDIKPNDQADSYAQTINQIGEGIWYIDSVSYQPIYLTPNCTRCGGIVMITTRDIHDNEELLFDYKYNINDPDLPSWYHPVTYS